MNTNTDRVVDQIEDVNKLVELGEASEETRGGTVGPYYDGIAYAFRP